MKVKKITSLFLILCVTLTMINLTIFADSKDTMSKSPDIVKQLKQLGFKDQTIFYLSCEEVNDILENNTRFEAASEESHTMYIKAGNKEYAAPLTETEFKTSIIDKKNRQEVAYKKLKDLANYSPEVKAYLEQQDKAIKDQVIYSSVPSYSQEIDAGIITTSVDIADSSTTSEIIKTMGLNFKWEVHPNWMLTDGLALSFTEKDYTNYKSRGGYYYHGNSTPDTIQTSFTGNGIKGTFDIITNHMAAQYGRIWVKVGNARSAVPYSLYTIYGQYDHTSIIFTGLGISIGAGGDISFSPSLGTSDDPTYQVYINDLVSNK